MRRWAGLVAVLALLAGACSDDDADEQAATTGVAVEEGIGGEALTDGWEIALRDGGDRWIVLARSDPALGRCFALRTARDSIDEMRAPPWPVLPSDPGYDSADEIASCLTAEDERSNPIIGLAYREVGTRGLELGVTESGTELLGFDATSQVAAFRRGNVFVIEAPDRAVVALSEFIVKDAEGRMRLCDEQQPLHDLGLLTCLDSSHATLPVAGEIGSEG